MLASFLIGLVGGQRALTPLAAIAVASNRGSLPARGAISVLLRHPAVAAAVVALAVGEMAGDKQKTAPDRIVPIGLAARFVTSAFAGAVLAPKHQRWLGALAGGSTGVVASYPGWWIRTAAIPRFGQTLTGLVEDTLVVAGAALIVRRLR